MVAEIVMAQTGDGPEIAALRLAWASGAAPDPVVSLCWKPLSTGGLPTSSTAQRGPRALTAQFRNSSLWR